MREYETLFVEHPETSAARAAEIEQRLRAIIAAQGGNVLGIDDWGVRELAYPIRHQRRGRYFLLRYESGREAVEELERNLKLMDEILRYITVRVPEKLRKGGLKASSPGAVSRKSEAERGSTESRQASEAV